MEKHIRSYRGRNARSAFINTIFFFRAGVPACGTFPLMIQMCIYASMPQRRLEQNDCVMFITTNVQNRKPLFKDSAYANEAIDQIYRVQLLRPFFLFGFVIMPDHCHFLVNVPVPETISQIIRIYKSGLAHQLGIGSIWQSRFHVRIPEHPGKALEYIHLNPVRAGLVSNPEQYDWSSASGKFDVTPLDMF